jgi:DNA modification methylase
MTIAPSIVLAGKIEHWKPARLQPYAKNARTHSDAQVDKLCASMIEFGFTAPILVDGEAGILAGHGRLLAAQKLGLELVPVVELTHLSAAQKRAYILADNRLAEDAGWDEDLLAAELKELAAAGFDVALTGFDSAEVDSYLSQTADADGSGADPDVAPAPEPERCVTQLGDLWVLGDHRLLCADARSIDALEVLLGGAAADCLWTDPPYNVDIGAKNRSLDRADKGSRHNSGDISNDAMSAEEFRTFLVAALSAAYAVLAPGAGAYVCYASSESESVYHAFEQVGFHLSSCLIWRKSILVLGRSDYHYMHEPIVYGWRGDGTHHWYGARDKVSMVEFAEAGLQQTGDNEWQLAQGETTLIIRGTDMTVSRAHGTLFFEAKPAASADHPTMKPVALIERMLGNSTKRADRVLDCFGGSGSTLIACQRLGRRAHLLEIEPKYCDVIVRRFQEFTGRAAILSRTSETFAQRALAIQHKQSGDSNERTGDSQIDLGRSSAQQRDAARVPKAKRPGKAAHATRKGQRR